MTYHLCLAPRLGIVGLASLLAVSSAWAGPITVTFQNVNPGYSPAGQYNWTSSSTIPGLVYTSGNNFATFCIEQNQYISPNTTYSNYMLTDLSNAPNPGSTLSATQINNLKAMWAQYRSSVDTNDEAAAFQHAVWHIVNPSYNPSLSGSVLSYYNQYLNSTTWMSGYANLVAMVHLNHQDHVVEIQRGWQVNQQGDLEPVPAPATLGVAFALGVALLVRQRLVRPAA
ncbi:MAG: hypothetical protein KatS3mg106_581 [Gemmataceae bacterium]|nr:MAG: hypothetical protein KatS3mg106_581 [Gemmataceae bacterium]